MASDRFRRDLRTEARQWLDEGAIAPEQYEWLQGRYGFEGLDLAARSRYLTLLLGLGGTLIGLGAIAFVAANWQDLSRELRMALMLAALVGSNVLGFYWWRGRPRFPGQQRTGAAFLLLGSILIGPNVGLMAQMFHQSGPSSTLFAVWSVGVAAMAWGLRLASLGGLSLILATVAWTGSFSIYGESLPPWLSLLTDRAALVFLFGFGPLAIACRSRLMFGAAIVVFGAALVEGLGSGGLGPISGMLSLATLVTLLLWGYRDRLVERWRRPWQEETATPSEQFEGVARRLAILWLSQMLYGLSFLFPWELDQEMGGGLEARMNPAMQVWGVLAIAVVALWLAAARRGALADRNTRQLLALLAIAAVIGTIHLKIAPIAAIATFAFNGLLALLAIATARHGLEQGDRMAFWGGGLLIALQVTSRTFEYDTGLLLKSAIFILSGVGVIVAGLIFERSLPSLTPTAATAATPAVPGGPNPPAPPTT
jgi:uncharacterized membrane protein